MDTIILILIVLLGLSFINLFRNQIPKQELYILNKLWFFHLLSSILFYLYTRNGGGDAWGYWKRAKAMDSSDFWFDLLESKGTGFMNAINYFPSKILDLSFFTNTLFFSLIGFFGLVFFYLLTFKVVPYNSKLKKYYLFPLVFFMPSLHFWSSGIGKDAILFLCIGMFCYGFQHISKRLPLLIFSLFLSFLIRPHITFFLVFSFGLAYFFNRNDIGIKRIVYSIILIGLGIAILPIVMEFVKIEDNTIQSFDEFSKEKSTLLSRSNVGSAIDISAYPFPLKVFSFLYRPFFIDGTSIPAIIASFENLVLLILSIRVLRNKPLETFRKAPFVIQGMVYFLIIGVLAFSQSLGNIGIMIRMRNMFLPGLLIFMLWSFSYKQQQLAAKRKRK
ncbi:hypothetical protein [Flavobacterium capsici]|uniref:Uncharacterized protein n=1 Tax=Flavobacterium capsici TaxID=3075618 RepID=A0AA96J360_9FLAO|nr:MULTISPECIES: hypothetical protein [unclassified Flavobacterium]WNM20232.1 hypothetical protein RN608_06010 [Flavobacterium sp. PMR2A8]WNM21622.1 hypothetical protein RN605_13180 [Flavobacterium sp. PMTSA4]